jgi:hypothetical protein
VLAAAVNFRHSLLVSVNLVLVVGIKTEYYDDPILFNHSVKCMDNYVLVFTECCCLFSCDVTAPLHFLAVLLLCWFSDANLFLLSLVNPSSDARLSGSCCGSCSSLWLSVSLWCLFEVCTVTVGCWLLSLMFFRVNHPLWWSTGGLFV